MQVAAGVTTVLLAAAGAMAHGLRHPRAGRAAAPLDLAAARVPDLVLLGDLLANQARRQPPPRRTPFDRLARLGLPLYCGGGRGPFVALTFDDGPGPYTARLLALLRDGGARATFFLVGNRLVDWPEAAVAEHKLGGVGDHTWDHARLPFLRPRTAARDIVAGHDALVERIGRPVRFFRPPYGRLTAALARVVRRHGMLQVRWSVDSRDYAPRSTARAVVRRVGRELRPGAIVLMHDIHPWTIEAVPRILDLLRRRGLIAISVEELVALDAPSTAQVRSDARAHRCLKRRLPRALRQVLRRPHPIRPLLAV